MSFSGYRHSLVRVAVDVYVNFFEVASIEAEDDNVLIVLKSGHKVVIANTTVGDVNAAIEAFITGAPAGRRVPLSDYE